MPGLVIPETILDAIIAQARAAAPLEACGILSGRDGRVLLAHAMANADQSADHFSMEPREQFAVAKKIRAAGHETLAIYHSHPSSPARPSEEDIRLAYTPDVVHVVLSLQEPNRPVVRGFYIRDAGVEPAPVEIVPGSPREGDDGYEH